MKDLLYAMHNGTSVPLAEVPPVGNDAFFEGLIDALTGGWRVSSYFGIPDARGAELYCILTSKADGVIGVARTAVADSFPSLAGDFPQLHLFEREIAEQCALTPLGHPWLKPVRFQRPFNDRRPFWEGTDGDGLRPGVMPF